MRFVLLVILHLSRASNIEIIEHKDETFVPGIHLEEVNEILYDAYIPLIYEIPQPSWSESDLSVPIYLSSYFHACTNDKFYDNYTHYICPVSFHMKEVIQRMSDGLQVSNNISRSNYTYGGFQNDISCSKLQQQFRKSSVLSNEDWNQYLSDLNDCKPAKVFFETVTLSVNSSVYGNMLKNFFFVYSTKTYYSNHERMAAFTNAYGIFQTAQLAEFILMKSKWNEAVSACKSGRIPTSVIPIAKLQSSIDNIQSFLSSTSEGETLSIEGVSEMTDYLNLPLADCTLLENSSLIVSIQIPIRRESSSPERTYKIKTTPFLRKLASSDGMETFEICEFTESLGDLRRLRLVSKNKLDYLQASCDQDYPLCQIKNSVENQCLFNILSNNTEYITEECPMNCKTINKDSDLPHVRRMSPDTWIILEERTNKDIFVNCDSKPVKMISGLKGAGSLQITVPCDCQLLHRGKSLNSSKPCGPSLIVKEIKPYFFNKLSKEEQKNNANTESTHIPLVTILLSSFACVLSCVAIVIGLLVLKKMLSMEELLKLR